MTRFNKFDSNANPKWEPDALVQFELFATEKSGRKREVVNGYRPQYKVRRDYLTSTFHFFLDRESVKPGESSRAFVKFITPDAYPHPLKVGQNILVHEGSQLIGQVKLLEIYNKRVM